MPALQARRSPDRRPDPAVEGLRLVVPPEILEAVLATAASGDNVDQQLSALRDIVTRFAEAEGATPR